MRGIYLVARREFETTVLNWKFILGNLALPLGLVGIGIFFSVVAGVAVASRQAETIAIVDEVGEFADTVAEQLETLHTPEIVDVRTTTLDDLAKRVNDKELYGYIVLDAATKDDASFRLYSLEPPSVTMQGALQYAVYRAVLDETLTQANLAERFAALEEGGALKWVDLDNDVEASDDAIRVTPALAGIAGFIVLGAMSLLPAVVSSRTTVERQSGLVEILACSVRPTELVLGKAAATLSVGLASVFLWSVPGLVFGTMAQMAVPEFGELWSDTFAAKLMDGMGIALPLVTFLLSLCVFFTVTTVVTSIALLARDERVAGRVSMLTAVAVYAVMPFVFIAVESPEGKATQIMSFVPIIGAPVMAVRMAFEAPWWHAAIVVGMHVGCLVFAGWLMGRLMTASMRLGGMPKSLGDLRLMLRS